MQNTPPNQPDSGKTQWNSIELAMILTKNFVDAIHSELTVLNNKSRYGSNLQAPLLIPPVSSLPQVTNFNNKFIMIRYYWNPADFFIKKDVVPRVWIQWLKLEYKSKAKMYEDSYDLI